MRLYKANSDYIQYIYEKDHRIIHSNKMVGIPIRLNELIYFLPIDSPSSSDYEGSVLKNSSPTVMRMFDMKTKMYLGKCLFSNMFLIPYKELEIIDITQYDEEKIFLIEKKLEYLKKNHDRIIKQAKRIFKQKIKNYKQAYLESTVDFMKLEKASLEWEITKYGKHYNRFPDQKFFLTNPNKEGISEYYLMNKEIKIAKIALDNSSQKITDIIELYNPEYAPLECFKNHELDSIKMTTWFTGRGIPSWRDGLDDFLENLGLENKDSLINRAYGLSLSDQYWMNPVERQMDWKDINFFDHNFNSQDFIDASFEDKIVDERTVDFYSPNNTSDGMLKKTWIVGLDNQRYLLKESYKRKGLEPFNEVLAGMIAQAIGLEYVPYTIEVINKTIVSRCRSFITKDTELISAYAILVNDNIDLKESCEMVLNQYVKILSEHKVSEVEEKISKMFIIDYLMVNQDRHLGNFGVIRNVHTLEWVDVAPNFDSGQSMFSQKEVYEMNFEKAEGCFFNNKNLDFEVILKYSLILFPSLQLTFENLEKIPAQWELLLKEYQYISLMSDEKIDVLIEGLKLRIKKLKDHFIQRKKGIS